MTIEEYPYLAQLSVPDRLRLAAYEASDRGVPEIHVGVILDVPEGLERLIDPEGRNAGPTGSPTP
jgi:hypothetical protein